MTATATIALVVGLMIGAIIAVGTLCLLAAFGARDKQPRSETATYESE